MSTEHLRRGQPKPHQRDRVVPPAKRCASDPCHCKRLMASLTEAATSYSNRAGTYNTVSFPRALSKAISSRPYLSGLALKVGFEPKVKILNQKSIWSYVDDLFKIS